MEKNYVIYKLECLTDISGALLYVGSTANFRTRKMFHKTHCNNEKGNKKYNLPVYRMIRENGGWENWDMKPIEELNGATKIQAHIREQYWIEHYKYTSNGQRAYLSEEEKKEYLKDYYQENIEKFKNTTKEWAKNNREYRNAYQREWRLKKKTKANDIESNDKNQGESSPEIISDGDQL